LADALLDEVRSTLAAVERLCAQLAPIVDRSDWDEFDRLLVAMRRTRHALANAWDAAHAVRTPEFEAEIRERVQRVLAYREWHLQRMRTQNEEAGGRLNLISRWRSYARAVGERPAKSVLFSDIR
jgi:hypothetical protein